MMPSQALPHTYCQYMRRAGPVSYTHLSRHTPCSSSVSNAESVSLSSPAPSEHSPLESASGSIGTVSYTHLPLPKPADTDSMALWEQYYANQINIKNTDEGALNGFVDALFRLSVSIYGDTEDAKADVRAQWAVSYTHL